MSLTLVIGNKNYSSWSLRPWIAMKVAGIPFAEIVIPLYEPGSREEMLKYSPAGKVPILIDGDEHVWESLAILEHLAERFPDAGLWPQDRRARSHARVVATEMHAGFQPLRRDCTMNLWLPVKARPQSEEVLANMRRIEELWRECRARFGANGGPFLFGRFGAADAMYAPVVSRFHTYGLPVATDTRAYMDAVMALPAWREWTDAAMKETWVMKHNEPDWPLVRGVKVE
ncbi:glutathione S-transferase family protein [Pseudolabrys taiwanensis]|uniref:Glutathione S-transferase family protein n=1 Tax=Pseudolabrys taiwanensis TaxID=331696 RepID=A0A345ZS20_9HYPH|nr:glutathione S-transferase family protein [Pseudolabrys taiwanensis]AXK79717.1 glutathione S-transferase family protein [Pseudolabrys taiwanensis]